jgi:hypothetical protein
MILDQVKLYDFTFCIRFFTNWVFINATRHFKVSENRGKGFGASFAIKSGFDFPSDKNIFSMSFQSSVKILKIEIVSIFIHLVKMILDDILAKVGRIHFFEGLNRLFEHSEGFESADWVICSAFTLI